MIRLHTYQAARVTKTGGIEVGSVHINLKNKEVAVTFKSGSRRQRLGVFTIAQWSDQDTVNIALRQRGLAWRRTVSEIEYAAQNARRV